MIPIKLQIKNFLSYGSELQEVDFEPYNLICLSGKNGHGKSSLLDAMTWAIWGEARKTTGTSKPDHGLLRLGQRHMIVIFDFEFNKNKYRVRREFTFAYGKPYALLEFGMFETDEKLIPLTDKTIRTTQDKIELMIGLNYDSFCNSAFLRQGSSNEFSKKSAKERKEILAKILGLDKYETIRKIALERIKQRQLEKDGILKVQEHIEKEFLKNDEILTNLLQVNSEIEKITNLETNFANEKILLEIEKKDFAVKFNEYQIVDFQLKKLNEEKNKKIELLLELYANWKENHNKLINFPDEKILQNEKQNLVKIISDLQSKFEKKLELKEIYLKNKEQEQKLFHSINDKQNLIIQEKKIEVERLLANKLNFEEKINLIEKTIKENSKENKNFIIEIQNIESNIKAVDDQTFDKLEKQFEKRKNFYQQLIVNGNIIKSELLTLEQKKKLSSDEHNPSCPLCEQNLSASRKKFLKQQFSKHEKFLNHRLKRTAKIIQKLKEILLNQHDEINNLKKIIEQNKLNQIKVSDLKKNQERICLQIQAAEINKVDFAKTLNDLNILIHQKNNQIIEIQKQKFTENDEYKKILSELNEIEKKINEILYNQEEHKKFIKRLNEIDLNLLIFVNKSEIISIRENSKNEIYQLFFSIKSIKNDIRNLEQKAISYSFLKSDEQNLQKKEQNLLNSLYEINKKKRKSITSKRKF